METYGVYQHSHWQGSGPDTLLYAGSQAACENYAATLDSCSMCGPGMGGYNIGRCLHVRRPRHIGPDVIRLPDEMAEWDASDIKEWERAAYLYEH